MPTLEKGFSLIEVMITVAIVGILAAVAYPAYTDQIAKGKRNECRSGALQAMQQQERYYAQFNTYLAVAADATDPKIRTFSGDRAGSSACTIASAACPTPTGGTAPSVKACIEVQANLTKDPKKISMIYLDSLGNKGCVVNGSRSTSETACWK